VAVVLLFVMMMLTTGDVVGRYVLNSPIPGAYELNEFLMVAVVFLPLALVQAGQGHVRVELVLNRLPFRARLVMETIALIVALALYGLITWYGLQDALTNLRVGEHTIGLVSLPVWPSQMLVPVGSAVLCLQFLVHIVESVRRLVSGRM
jgi:TRAP-type C4-dicarboxylate transport system permease small subunit